MTERKYLPTLSYLIDLLSIVTLKSIKLSTKKYDGSLDKKKAYEEEAKLIMEDIDKIVREKTKSVKHWGKLIRAIQINMLTNEVIWENETNARLGGRECDYLLPLTHSVNAMRTRIGNIIANQFDERKDLNIDRMNDETSEERGYNWNFEW